VSKPRHAPIGVTWTRILKIVSEGTLITTVGVSEALWPLQTGQLRPSAVELGRAELMLTRMENRGYVRRARPWTGGKLWAVAERGREVLELLPYLAAPRRRYRTTTGHRERAKRRRDRLRSARLCINGASHGRATSGCRCDACHQAHRMTA
jgi:hypothetical protein